MAGDESFVKHEGIYDYSIFYEKENPFRTYTTDQAYFTGNPLLLPVKYYRQELSHSLNGKLGSLTLQLAASQTIGEITHFPIIWVTPL